MPNDEWGSPPKVVEMARSVMGSIDFDPCSNDEANKIIRADVYFKIIGPKSECTDGLKSPWPDGVNTWMNPPFSRGNPAAFICRIHLWWIHQRYKKSQAVILMNNDTETQWFQEALEMSDSLSLPKGRLHFIDPTTGKPANQTRQGQALFYLGHRQNEFCRKFSEIGYVL
jgi:phage N-6-adenine-methyltransferase